MKPLRLAVACTLVAAILPAAASGATAANEGFGLHYDAATGEANDLIVTATSADWVFTENTGVPVTAGPTCRRGASASQVLCARSPFGNFIIVNLGDRRDRAQPEEGFTGIIHGDAGDDLLIGSPDGGRLDGGAGADDLTCRNADCQMRGGSGPDRMRGVIDPKSSFPNGGGEVSYEDHVAGVTVTLDGVNNDGNATDGPAGARDNVTAIHWLAGTEGDDLITDGAAQGPNEPHVFFGLGGDDELRGLGGADRLYGGDGVDRLYGGDSHDWMEPDAHYLAAGQGDLVSGGDGTDAVHYLRPVGTRVSLNGVADDGRDADGDEVAEERDNVLADVEDAYGGDGDDVLQGNAAPNLIGGGLGHDRITGAGGADRLFGEEGEDKIDGGAQVDEVKGGTDADVLTGGSDADLVSGEEGADSLDGGTGADVLAGGTGNDTASYAARTVRVVVTMAGGADDGADTDGDGTADEGDDVTPSVENLVGGAGDDAVTGNAAHNRLYGGAAGDRLTGSGGNDLLDGGPSGDILDGGPGNDRFAQGKLPDGADGMTGGTGIDIADYSARTAAVVVGIDSDGGDGDALHDEGDFVRTDVETVLGGSAADFLTGAPVDNRLSGGDGDDVLDGGLGADDLAGGRGTDTVTYATRTGAVTADLDGVADDGTSFDQNAASVRDRVGTDVERLIGGAGADRLTGNTAPNRLTGGPGGDVLTGAGGIDQLYGGSGDDDLFSRGDGAADTAACEEGRADEVTADPADTVSGCEIER